MAEQNLAQAGRVEEHRDVEYAVHDGLPQKGHLYSPKAAGKYPALVAVHGGGWRLSTRENYRYLGPWLAERGYVVFAVTYRLSAPGQKSFPEAVQDVRAALQFVKGRAAELKVDPERIGLIGDSAGGHLASLVALAGEHPLFKNGNRSDPYGGLSTQVKAVATVYGVYDLVQQWCHDQTSRPREHIVEQLLGTSLIDDRRAYFDASPLSYVSAKNNATAFLIAWGTEDDIVDPKNQGEAFLEALKRAGYYVRSAILPGAPHFWIGDPLDETGSHSGFFAPRLLRFLQARL